MAGMHILHVFDHSIPLHSGYTFRSRAILQQQRAMGWRTSHITSPKHALSLPHDALAAARPVEEVDGLRFHRTAPAGGLAGRLPVLNQYAIMRALETRLDEVVTELAPDLIQAHSPALNALPAVRVARRHGIPVCYEVRAFWEDAAVSHGTSSDGGLRYRVTRAMETRALMQVDAVSCICEGLRADIIARGVPASKVTVIPNAVDVQRFEPIAARDAALADELGLADKPVVGFIGSYYAYEGLDLLLEALPALAARLPDIQLLLVGGGPEEDRLRAQAEALGILNRVHFIGRVPHAEVSRYYSLVDVFAYPRRSMRVTELVTPLKPLEAMAQQCIFVASDVGGHRELIRDGDTGLLFRKDDVDSLAEVLVRTLQHREQWPALRRAGRRFVEEERNWAASVAGYAPVYEALVERTARRRAS
jgi:PEP-CTERM/exosortase A-associated glycosyltransferase